MRTSLLAALASSLIALSAAAQNTNFDHLVLQPNGFAEHSYCSWKAHEGLADSTGTKDQALYFQKMTSSATFAAGVAVVEGVEGLSSNQLTGLSFYVRSDSHCGAGAPRWNVRVKPAVGPSMTTFLGCAAMAPGDLMTAPNGDVYQRRTVILPIPPGTITSLSIVFDEGDEVGPGYAFLDNVTVEVSGVPHVWTSAADNGNN